MKVKEAWVYTLEDFPKSEISILWTDKNDYFYQFNEIGNKENKSCLYKYKLNSLAKNYLIIKINRYFLLKRLSSFEKGLKK